MRFLIIVSLLVLGINNLLPFVFKIQSNGGVTVACLSIIFTLTFMRYLENVDENKQYRRLQYEYDHAKKTSVFDDFLKTLKKWNDSIQYQRKTSVSFYTVRITDGTWAIDCTNGDDRKYHKVIHLEDRGRRNDLNYLLHYFRTEHSCEVELPTKVKSAMLKLIENKVDLRQFSLISKNSYTEHHISIFFN